MPRVRALTSFLIVAFVASLPRPGGAQSFYEASDLLPPHTFDIALGAAVVDVNSDGLVDLFRRDRIYLQEMDGTFTDVYEAMDLEQLFGASFGAVFGDANNDGFVETFLIDLGESLPFYLGDGGLFFQQHSHDSGIRDVTLVQGTMWLDFNRDGLLDLFVGIDGGLPRLYRNVGLDFFQNVAATSGFGYKNAYGVAAADFDDDGDVDIMLTQCFPPTQGELQLNALWRNSDGMFEDVAETLGIVDDLPSWGVVWLLGRRLEVLHEGRLTPGKHRYEWNGSDVSPGIYVIRLTAGKRHVARTVVRAK